MGSRRSSCALPKIVQPDPELHQSQKFSVNENPSEDILIKNSLSKILQQIEKKAKFRQDIRESLPLQTRKIVKKSREILIDNKSYHNPTLQHFKSYSSIPPTNHIANDIKKQKKLLIIKPSAEAKEDMEMSPWEKICTSSRSSFQSTYYNITET